MVKTRLKSTSNANMQYLVGAEGLLSVEADDRFHFHFLDGEGREKDLNSKVMNSIGDLDNPNSKEVGFQTRSSIYVFEKMERQKEKLYSFLPEEDSSFIPEASKPIRTKLKSTTNPNLLPYVEIEGMLSMGLDGKFKFQFLDQYMQPQSITSSVQRYLGSFENPASKELCFDTAHSTYVFEKLELMRDGLFSHHQQTPLSDKISTAEEKREQQLAMDRAYGSLLKNSQYGQNHPQIER